MIFVMSFILVILISFITSNSFGTLSEINSTLIRSSNSSNQTYSDNDNSKKNFSMPPANINKDKGTLLVNVTTINGELGKNTSSDFLVKVHGNDPVPPVFKGNPKGTIVELAMGMYSITLSSIPNYNSSFSGDCSGGIMQIETKVCNITNTYFKS